MFKLTPVGTSAAVLPALLLASTSVATPVYSVDSSDTGFVTYITSNGPGGPIPPELLVRFSFAGPSITITGEAEGYTEAFALPFSGGLTQPLAIGFEPGGVVNGNSVFYLGDAYVTTLADFTLTSAGQPVSVPALVTGELAACLTASQNCSQFVENFDVSFDVPGVLTLTAYPALETGLSGLYIFSVDQFTTVPEPASLPLAGAGLAAIAMLKRHQRRGSTSPPVSPHSAGSTGLPAT
jgi:PEP-CTERM motif